MNWALSVLSHRLPIKLKACLDVAQPVSTHAMYITAFILCLESRLGGGKTSLIEECCSPSWSAVCLDQEKQQEERITTQTPFAIMARFAVSDAHDQSAALWIVTFLLLSYTTLTTLVRVFVKFSMLGLDDGVAGLAQLLAYGNVFSVIYALRLGLARKSQGDETMGVEAGYEKVSDASQSPRLKTDRTRRYKRVPYCTFSAWRRQN